MLREVGVTGRILVMCGLFAGEEEDALLNLLTPAVFRLQDAKALAHAGARLHLDRPVSVHLKIDTGMGRLGLPLAELETFADGVKRLPQVELEGVFSHLASSEVLDDEGTQLARLSASMRRCAPLAPMDSIPRFATWPTAARWERAPAPGITSCAQVWRFTATNSIGLTVTVRSQRLFRCYR